MPTASASTSARRSAPPIPSAQPSSASPSSFANSRRDGIDIRAIDAGGGLGIDYHDADFDPAAKVAEYAAALDRALAGFDRPPAPRAGPLHRRPGRCAAHPRAPRQAERHQDLRHHRRRHERPDSPRALPGASRDRSRAPASRQSAPRRCSRPGLRNRRLLRPRPPAQASQARRPRSRSSTPAPTAWRKAPTTTRARAPPKS